MSTDYRAGLERALAALRKEKLKHSILAPEYFALVHVYEELREELGTREEAK
jgi:hypothetical protein